MTIEILHRFTDAVLYRSETATTQAEAVREALGLTPKANLSYADLRGANLSYADLSYADLSYADLSYADLRGADLRGANLRDANLRGADLRGADLRGADLRGANLSYADLRDADLRDANLRGANLSGADLRDADLRDANLRGANLYGADLYGATVGGKPLDRWPGIDPDPTLPLRVAQAVLIPGSLEMATWHTCETTHCLAGWAVHLSGPAGYALEKVTSSSVAGAMLLPSASHLFYESNEAAIAWAKGVIDSANGAK